MSCGARSSSAISPKTHCGGWIHSTSTAERAKGAVVFTEGQRPDGVYVVCRGHVKLSASSGGARSLITDMGSSALLMTLNSVSLK